MTSYSTPATVLIVEDEQSLADLYAQFLASTYTVHTAADGTKALDRMSHDVEVVLLDRRMPGLSGEEVLRAIRQKGYDCKVAMVTAVSPDVDIIEMGFDDYLTKPVDKTELNELVEGLLGLNNHDALVQEYYQLTTKMEALEDEQNVFELVENEMYKQLQDRLGELDDELDQKQRSVAESYQRNILDRYKSHPNHRRRSPSRGQDRPDRVF